MSDRELLQTRRFRVVERTYADPHGLEHRREVILHPGAVVILPLLDDDRICLVRNYRPAVGAWLLELPAGTCEPPEPPAATAARELIEETGFRAARIEAGPEFFMSPGILCERMHLFLARDLSPVPARPEPGELVEPVELALDESLAMADDGRICDAKTLAALYWWDRRRRLR